MANWKSQSSNDWPATGYNKIIDNDPMIVRVPLDNVDWGSRKSQMSRVMRSEGENPQRLGIKHVPSNGKGA